MKRRLVSAFLAIATFSGIAGQVLAASSDDISPRDTKRYYDQLDRENRGGNSNGGG
jgi:hypothetical protein